MSSNRRNFLKQLGSSAIVLGAGSFQDLAARERHERIVLQSQTRYNANDKLRIATIGMGIMGYNDTQTAVKVPGVELVACCDLYSGRLQRAQELYGKDIFITKDYKEILDRKDIDAVIVATSDNWHSTISIDALRKGKAVYSEKPIVHKFDQGWQVINAQRETKKPMQIGSQRISSMVFAKARELYKAGDIGKINSVEAVFNRQSALGAWEYTIPLDASSKTVDWERYQSLAAHKTAYDEKKFFWWRNYRDFGTGVAGDLFVHLLTGLHYITESKGPSSIYSIGGLTYWKDGRDVPDVMTAVLEYPETKEHSAFQVVLRVNFVSGEGDTGYTRITGTEGVMEMGYDGFTIKKHKMAKAPGYGGWDALSTYPEAMQKQIIDAYNKKYSKADQEVPKLPSVTYTAPKDEDEHLVHFANFFDAVRNGTPVIEPADFAFRAAGPCLACNESYFQKKVIYWDAENIKTV